MFGVVQLINDASIHENSNNDQELAFKLYKSAYNCILDVNAQACSALNQTQGANLVEIRSIADFLNFKLCQLQFSLNHAREAITQFRKFIDTFKNHTKDADYAFEHSAWLSQQYSLFADLFEEAIVKGVKASKLQHPGYYYLEVAMQMIERRKNLTEYTNDSLRFSNMPVTQELLSMFTTRDFPSFLVQCGWRCINPDDGCPPVVSSKTGDMANFNANYNNVVTPIEVKYSDIIIKSLYKAMKHFEDWGKHRMFSHAAVIVADEYMLIKEFSKANSLYERSLQVYEKENWKELADDIRMKIGIAMENLPQLGG